MSVGEIWTLYMSVGAFRRSFFDAARDIIHVRCVSVGCEKARKIKVFRIGHL